MKNKPNNYRKGIIEYNFLEDATNPRGFGATYFHEMAHAADEALGFISQKINLNSSLYKDMDSYKEKEKIIKEFQGKDMKYSAVSDILNALFKTEEIPPASHSIYYWDESSLKAEFFAHFIESQFDGKRRGLLEKYFPKMYNETKKMLGEEIKRRK